MDFPLILLLLASMTSFYVSSASDPWHEKRLPRSLKPLHYDLFMQPVFYSGNDFNGKVFIQMVVEKQTKFIIVHAEKLNISTTKVFMNNTILMPLARYFPHEANSYFVVETEERMVAGSRIKLELVFTGQIYHRTGVYKDGYVSETTGEFYPMVATRFWPIYARRAFPNFDEPFFKSQFTIRLRHWANYTAVSSTPEQDSRMYDRVWRDTLFKKTPPINSFLVSFVISNLPYRNNTLPGEKPHRLWGRSDRLAQIDFAFNMTPVIQHYLNRELPVIYPLQKLDQFLMPNSGWIVSWGLIACPEERILLDPIFDGERERRTALEGLAFQMAYSYFANFVTCRNWDHAWLNLGLATFYQLKSAWIADPTVHLEEKFIEKCFAEDATIHSRPLLTYASTSTFPIDNFRALIYYKGAAVLKMMERFLGVRPLKRGIRRFIKNNTNSTVLTQDLWNSLQEEIDASLDILEIMKTWVHSMGFPVISIKLLPDNTINATQKRFLLDPLKNLNNPPSKHGYKWYVPLTYQTKERNFGLVWMNKTDAVLGNLLTANDDWILFNHDQSGYYRVNYDAVLWGRITKQLNDNHTVFTEKQRSKLLIESMNLAKAEQLGYDVVLDLTRYAGRERSLQPWVHISTELIFIYHKVVNTQTSYQSYVLNLTTSLMDELQVVDEGSNSDKLLRRMIIDLSCLNGHRGCLENLTRMFEAWIQNETNVVPANFRTEIHCIGMSFSLVESSFAWNITFERYIIAESERYRRELLNDLTCSFDKTLLDKLMDIYISNTSRKILYDDFKLAAGKFAEHRPNSRYLWQWLKLRHREVISRYTKHVFVDIILKIADTFDTDAESDEIIRFIHDLENAERQIKRYEKRAGFPSDFIPEVRRRIKSNIRWINRNNATVNSWFQQNA